MNDSCVSCPSNLEVSSVKTVDGKLEDTRNFKGYWFEMKCKPIMEAVPHIKYECNPTCYEDWKHQQANNPLGYDGVITLPNGDKVHLEMKYRQDGEKVYHNWFDRDWLPRDADIYVTNNVEAISYRDKRNLDSKSKKLMYPSEAVAYIRGLVHKILHPNQYVYWNSLITKIITVTRTLFFEITSKFVVLRRKRRLKEGLFGDAMSVGAGIVALQSNFKVKLKSLSKKIQAKVFLGMIG